MGLHDCEHCGLDMHHDCTCNFEAIELRAAIDRSPYEIGTCAKCGEMVVWAPKFTVRHAALFGYDPAWYLFDGVFHSCRSHNRSDTQAKANELNAQHGPVCEGCKQT